MQRLPAVHLVIIILFGIISYANSFSNAFLYDDEHYIQRNSYLRDFSHLKDIFTENVGAGALRKDNFYRPMQILAYAVIYHIFGLNVFGYHLLNFLLHLANALLIYFFIYSLFKREDVSFISSLLFMVHPVHTEAVTYISGTADPLAMFFGMLALIFYLKANKTTVNYFISLVFFVFALMSKETMVALPWLIIAIDLYKRDFNFKKSARYTPYFLLMCVYVVIRSTVFNFTKSLNLFESSNIYTQNLHYRIFTFLAGLLEYYRLLLFPVALRYDRAMVVFTSPFVPEVLFSLILLVAIFYFIYRSFKGNRVIFLGCSWFFVSLFPVSGVMIPINGFVMEHWLYFPSLGFLMVFAYMVTCNKSSSFKKDREVILVLLMVAIIFSFLTIKRNRDWRDPITFYNKILEHNPDIARVHNNLAMAYSDAGEIDEAEGHYKMAITLEDRYPETHHNLAQLYLKKGKTLEAIAEFKKAISIDNNFIYSHLALREAYAALGMIAEAEVESRKIDKIDSGLQKRQ